METMSSIEYTCEECGRSVSCATDAPTPECCGKSMTTAGLDRCTRPANAEYSRPMDEEDACDDGRAGS
jgi:hypothetical protein